MSRKAWEANMKCTRGFGSRNAFSGGVDKMEMEICEMKLKNSII